GHEELTPSFPRKFRHPGESRDPSLSTYGCFPVTRNADGWVPAFAGMTDGRMDYQIFEVGNGTQLLGNPHRHPAGFAIAPQVVGDCEQLCGRGGGGLAAIEVAVPVLDAGEPAFGREADDA